MSEIRDKLLESSVGSRTYVSTGCSLLNLAISDDVSKGYECGTVVNLIGSTHAGKSLMAGTCIAEAAHSSNMKEYLLNYDDTENGFKFDVKEVFGEVTAKKIQYPYKTEQNLPRGSKSLLEAHLAINKLIGSKKPFISVLDSLDGLMSQETLELVEANLNNYEAGKKLSGSYGMEKQKYLSQSFFPSIMSAIADTKSLILILSQQGKEITGYQSKNRAGGKALKFYVGLTLWVNPSMNSKIKKKLKNGLELCIGTNVSVEVSKNRISGKPRAVNMVILHGYGIDDVQTSLNWLKEYGYWDVVIEKLGIKYATIPPVIKFVEENNKEEKLKAILQECWNDVEEQVTPKRKERY